MTGVDDIIQQSAAQYNVNILELKNPKIRSSAVVESRKIAAKRLFYELNLSILGVGRVLNQRAPRYGRGIYKW